MCVAYPHTTVIDGYQVNIVYFKDGALVRPDLADLTRTVEAGIRQLSLNDASVASRLRRLLQRDSLSAHLVDALLTSSNRRFPDPEAARPTSVYGESVYQAAPFGVIRHYLDDPRTWDNRQAIKQWGDDARARGYRLVFVLIPLQTGIADPTVFDSVKVWLRACGIEYVDLTALFGQLGVTPDDVYWPQNGHLNERGSVLVGEELSRRVH